MGNRGRCLFCSASLKGKRKDARHCSATCQWRTKSGRTPRPIPRPYPETVQEVDLAYAAGLFDGEGTVDIARPTLRKPTYSPRHTLQIKVGNTSPGVIMWLRSVFGGSITKRLLRPPRRPLWVWSLSTLQAKNFLESVLPFLRIKQQEATIAIELQEAVMKYKAKMMRTNRWAKPFRLEEEEIQRRETLALRLVEVRRCGGLL